MRIIYRCEPCTAKRHAYAEGRLQTEHAQADIGRVATCKLHAADLQ